MTATTSRSAKFRVSFSILSRAIGAFRAWNQDRRHRRILEGLSDAQLRDIGHERPSRNRR